MKIKGSNVTLMVASMAKSIRFYTETLGLKLKVRHSSHWAEIEAGKMTIGLHPKVKTKKIIHGDNMSIGLEVENIEKVMNELTPKGLVFDFKKGSVVRQAYFNDPDNHVLYFFQHAGKKR